MAKKNLPNIPLYIGDWEKDCNVLSLETEAAWLRIIFKMFTNGKESTYKIPTKGLQNLWRVSEDQAQEIIEELLDYNICDIRFEGRFVEFTCRRFEKENNVSEIRKKAVSNRKDRTKPLQNAYKKDTNNIQNTDIDYEIDNDNILKEEGLEEENFFEENLELKEIQNSEFFKTASEFFSQTTEVQKMKMLGDLLRIHRKGKWSDLNKQTTAYISYKQMTDESVHRWQNYIQEWQNENWVELLKKQHGKSNSKTRPTSSGKISGTSAILSGTTYSEFADDC